MIEFVDFEDRDLWDWHSRRPFRPTKKLLRSEMESLQEEHTKVLFCAKGKLLRMYTIKKPFLSSIEEIKELLRIAPTTDAEFIWLVHNHVDKPAITYAHDPELRETWKLQRIAKKLGVPITEHLVISRHGRKCIEMRLEIPSYLTVRVRR